MPNTNDERTVSKKGINVHTMTLFKFFFTTKEVSLKMKYLLLCKFQLRNMFIQAGYNQTLPNLFLNVFLIVVICKTLFLIVFALKVNSSSLSTCNEKSKNCVHKLKKFGEEIIKSMDK
ncbi:hypothetical protein RFI_25979 [Reticulomyxa filosa]|uniref:Transmembrane protein n=1 Tax=Reticulomyxa filosa TaxID=46433 RepID=X6MCN6_RETFI|nr:hypothetical protein RFI_25979 [Reticulomyxa filosa]|eukprot:ETO11396.1 hypothetical protein RFI_25979 [Reticulomyxa filosa]